ncbi:unnamed protein product, partial [Medioppia subpectinata]
MNDHNCYCGSMAIPPGVDILTKTGTKGSETGSTFSSKSYYEHNIRVQYVCRDETALLVGNNVRHCRYGHWTGDIPRCAIAYDNNTYRMNKNNETQIDTNVGNNEKQVKPDGCLSWDTDGLAHIFSTTLLHQAPIDYIRLKLYSFPLKALGSQTFGYRFRASLVTDYGTDECRLSRTDPPLVDSETSDGYLTVEFECNHRNHTLNKQIYFGVGFEGDLQNFYQSFPNKTDSSELMACDVKLYHFNPDCGKPDEPLVMDMMMIGGSNNGHKYKCNDNRYTLYGAHTVECGPNGQWLKTFPR